MWLGRVVCRIACGLVYTLVGLSLALDSGGLAWGMFGIGVWWVVRDLALLAWMKAPARRKLAPRRLRGHSGTLTGPGDRLAPFSVCYGL